MVEKIKKISNPLTIIAVFTALAETAGTVSLVMLPLQIQEVFVWFVMLLPLLLISLFFLTLNFNTKVLYAPSDYEDENNFVDILDKKNKLNKDINDVEKKVTDINRNLENKIKSLSTEQKTELKKIVSKETSTILKKVNDTKNSVNEIVSEVFPKNYDEKPD